MPDRIERINLTPKVYSDELVPALKNWRSLLVERGINAHLLFLFGSVVNQPEAMEVDSPIQALAKEIVGVRTGERKFRPESDIDVGAIVDDGEDWIDLQQHGLRSAFRMTKVGGHVLSLTRFTTTWIQKRGITLDDVRDGAEFDLSIYGRVFPVKL